MDGMKSQIKSMLQGIERYNPENIKTLEHYVDLQAREKGYDPLQKYFIVNNTMHELYFDQVGAGALLYLIQNITTRSKYNECTYYLF